MLRKLLFLVMGIIVVLFIYNTYFKTEEVLKPPTIDEEVETNNMHYNVGNNYKIDAKNVVEKAKGESTEFEAAKAFFKGAQIRGKQAILDKYKNLVLQGSIVGKSKYGIEFNTETIKYDDAAKKFYSNTKFVARQRLNKLYLEGDNFEAPDTFDVITLTGNVKGIYDTMTLTCNKMIYERENRTVKLFDNIKFYGKNIATDKGKIDEISGNAQFATYDMKSDVLNLWGKFKFLYKGYTFEGNNLIYEKATGNITAFDSIRLTKDDLFATTNKLTYENEKKKMYLPETFSGKKGKYNFNASRGEMDTEKEDFSAYGNISVYDQDTRISGGFLEYKKSEGKMYLKDENPNSRISIVGKDYSGFAYQAVYNEKENKMNVDGEFTIFITKEQKTFKMTGIKLVYSNDTESGTAKNVIIKKTEDKNQGNNIKIENIFCDDLEYDFRKEFYVFTGNVRGEYEDYVLTTDKAYLDQKNEKIYTQEKFTIENQKEKLKLIGKNGVFNSKTKYADITEGAEIHKDGNITKGKTLHFDIDKEKGELKDEIEITRPSDNLKVTCDKLTYEKRKYVKQEDLKAKGRIPGNYIRIDNSKVNDEQYMSGTINTGGQERILWYRLAEDDEIEKSKNSQKGIEDYKNIVWLWGPITATKDGNVIKSKDGYYDSAAKKIYMNYEITIENKESIFSAKARDGVYDDNTKILYLHEPDGSKAVDYKKGKKETVLFNSGRGYYYTDKDIFNMRDGVTVNVDTIKITSEEVDYYINTGEVVSNRKVNIQDKNLLVVGKKGKINTLKRTIQANVVNLTTDEGDKMTGDYLDGDYTKKEFNFKDNLVANLRDGSKFSGDLAKMFFVVENEDYKVSRGEIKNKTKFEYKDMVMDAEYLEFDNIKSLVYGKQKPKLKVQADTESTADYMYIDINSETGWMTSNVKVTHVSANKDIGTMNSTSDNAYLRNKEKLIEFTGHVTVFQNKNKVETQKGIYNLKTEELSGDGNINFKYLIEKNKDKKSKKVTTGAAITGSAITSGGITTGASIVTGSALSSRSAIVTGNVTTNNAVKAVIPITKTTNITSGRAIKE